MSSKVWDDLSFWNVDFSQVCPEFTLRRINDLECAVLEALDYVIKVPAGEYAKYYFHARSIATKLGYKSKDIDTIAPLTWDEAQKLQLSTEKYIGDQVHIFSNLKLHRTESKKDAAVGSLRPRGKTVMSDGHSPSRRASIAIEEIISKDHVHADGTKGSPKRRNSASFSAEFGGACSSSIDDSPPR